MIENIASAIKFFSKLSYYKKIPEFREVKKDTFRAIFAGASVNVILDEPYVTLAVEEQGKKRIVIENRVSMATATVHEQKDSYPIVKGVHVYSFIPIQSDLEEMIVTECTTTNRVWSDTKRIQAFTSSVTEDYTLEGKLLKRTYTAGLNASSSLPSEWVDEDDTLDIAKIVAPEELGPKLKYTNKQAQ